MTSRLTTILSGLWVLAFMALAGVAVSGTTVGRDAVGGVVLGTIENVMRGSVCEIAGHGELMIPPSNGDLDTLFAWVEVFDGTGLGSTVKYRLAVYKWHGFAGGNATLVDSTTNDISYAIPASATQTVRFAGPVVNRASILSTDTFTVMAWALSSASYTCRLPHDTISTDTAWTVNRTYSTNGWPTSTGKTVTANLRYGVGFIYTPSAAGVNPRRRKVLAIPDPIGLIHEARSSFAGDDDEVPL